MAELTLSAFLREEQRRGFDWREAHCLLLPADWTVVNALPDPAAPWRSTVTDEATALDLVAAAGGMARFAAAAMAAVGVLRIPTHAVRRGDVGVIRVIGPDGPAEVGGICTGERWASRSPRGLWIGRADPVAAWRLEV